MSVRLPFVCAPTVPGVPDVVAVVVVCVDKPVPLQRCRQVPQRVSARSEHRTRTMSREEPTLLLSVGQHDRYRHHSHALFGSDV